MSYNVFWIVALCDSEVYDHLTWTVEVGRLDAIARPTHAEVAVWSVDTDLITIAIVCQTLILCSNYTQHQQPLQQFLGNSFAAFL